MRGSSCVFAIGLSALACNSDAFNNNNDAGDAQPDVPSVNGGGDSGTDASTTCDPIAQTGCAQNEKCTWVRDAVSTETGEVRCVPGGNAANGGNCSYGASGPTTGYDNCEKGLICQAPFTEAAAGTCAPICTTAATSGPGVCATNATCVVSGGYFLKGNQTTSVGLCQPQCDPLTQVRLTDNAAHCGGAVNGTQPTLGCYGVPSQNSQPTAFVCSPAGAIANTSDVVCDSTNGCGPFVNGCAPGFVPVLPLATGSSTVICAALCKPTDTSTTASSNAGGSAPYTCAAAGAGGTHECRYWWYFEGKSTPKSSSSDGLGVCFDYTKYEYDSNNDTVPDKPDPSCTSLSTSAHNFDATLSDAAYWGCIAK